MNYNTMSQSKVNFQTNDDSSFKIQFTDNDRYLNDGTVILPKNSLGYVVDESSLITLIKPCGDPYISFKIADTQFADLAGFEAWFAENAVGGGGGSVDPEQLAGLIADAEYISSATTIAFYNLDGDEVCHIDATDFIKDGMVSNVEVVGTNLVITFNVASGKQPISIPLTSFFDGSQYYDKTAIDTMLATKADTTLVNAIAVEVATKVAMSTYNAYTAATNTALSGKADVSAVTAVADSLSGKQDTLIAGSGITISGNVISALDNVPPLPLYLPSEEGADGEFTEFCYDKWTILSVSQNMEGYEEDDVHFEFYIQTVDEENTYWVQVLKDGSFKYYDANPTSEGANELSPDDVPFYGYTVNNIPTLNINGDFEFFSSLTFYALLKEEYYDENDDCVYFNVAANFYDDDGYLSAYYDDGDGYIYRSLRETLLMMNTTLSNRIYQAMNASNNKVDQWTFNTYTANTNTALSNKADASAVTAISDAVSGKVDTVDYDEAQRVTAIALIDLNERKQDTLVAGSGITISGNVISADGGTSSDPNKLDVSAFTAYSAATATAISGKADTSAVTAAIDAVTPCVFDFGRAATLGITDDDWNNVMDAYVNHKPIIGILGILRYVCESLVLNTDADDHQVFTFTVSDDTSRYILSVTNLGNSTYQITQYDTIALPTTNDITNWNGKQDALVSGTNIKTINNESILGSGNISVSVDLTNYYTKTEIDSMIGTAITQLQAI